MILRVRSKLLDGWHHTKIHICTSLHPLLNIICVAFHPSASLTRGSSPTRSPVVQLLEHPPPSGCFHCRRGSLSQAGHSSDWFHLEAVWEEVSHSFNILRMFIVINRMYKIITLFHNYTLTSPSGPMAGAWPSATSNCNNNAYHPWVLPLFGAVIPIIRCYSRSFTHLLLFLLLFLFLLESLRRLMSSDQLSEVGDILVGLLQQVRQTLILFLVDEFTIALLILGLNRHTEMSDMWNSYMCDCGYLLKLLPSASSSSLSQCAHFPSSAPVQYWRDMWPQLWSASEFCPWWSGGTLWSLWRAAGCCWGTPRNMAWASVKMEWRHDRAANVSPVPTTAGVTSICYLMFLPAFALLLNLLLLLQLLCDAGFPQRLALASLVGLGVESGL